MRLHTKIARFAFATACLALVQLAACKQVETSATKSFIGLEAGQDGEIRKSNSPIFLALSDWFQKFKMNSTAKAAPGIRTNAAGLQTSVPSEFRKLITNYLEVQLKRTDELVAALDGKQFPRVRALLDLETKEMKDIALVMIMDGYTPVTDDLLARFMAAARKKGDFVDTFAATGFLDRLLAVSNVPTLVNDIEKQRLAYLEALDTRYLGNDKSLADFAAFLKTTRGTIVTMIDAMQGGAGLALAEGAEVSGPAAVLAAFAQSGSKKLRDEATARRKVIEIRRQQAAKRRGAGLGLNETVFDPTAGAGGARAATGATGAAPATPPAADGAAVAAAVQSTPSKADDVLAFPNLVAPQGSSPLDEITDIQEPAAAITKEETADGKVSASEGTVAPGGGPAPGPTPGQAVSAAGAGAPGGTTQPADPANSLVDLLALFKGAGLTDNEGNSRKTKLLAAPLVDCNQYKLKGKGLVECHRYAGFANLNLNNTAPRPTGPGMRGLGLTLDIPEATLALGRNALVGGEASESGDGATRAGQIKQQGSIGSCSVQASTLAGEIAGIGEGINLRAGGSGLAGESWPLTGDAVNSVFSSIQGEEATLEGAMRTLRQLTSDKFNMPDDEELRINGWDDAITCLGNGHPVLVGVTIDMATWTSGGGGAEFGLTESASIDDIGRPRSNGRGLGLAGGGGQLTCSQANGHAVVGVGYDSEKNIMIANSWGANWNGKGVGRVMRNSCESALFAFCIKLTKK